MAVIASLKDVAALLKAEEALCLQKVKQVVIMGGVEPFTPGEARLNTPSPNLNQDPASHPMTGPEGDFSGARYGP